MLLDLFTETDIVVRKALAEVTNWGLLDAQEQAHSGQHYPDIVADEAARKVLGVAPVVAIMCEESGWSFVNKGPKFLERNLSSPDNLNEDPIFEHTKTFDYAKLEKGEVLVVMDPLDGSTNASKRIPWYALSLCAVDKEGLLAAYISNLATYGSSAQEIKAYTAIRGEGAKYASKEIAPANVTDLSGALVSFCSFPTDGVPDWLVPCQQLRSFGAAALEIALVANGGLDVYADCTKGQHAPWDYLAAMLICQEAGAKIWDGNGKNLLELNMQTRRKPLAAATLELQEEITARYQGA